MEKALAIAKAFCFARLAALVCADLLAGCAESTNAFRALLDQSGANSVHRLEILLLNRLEQHLTGG
jgi:hypothetical protein